MKRPILGFHLDEERQWVAALGCGHQQHVRHKPPFIERFWTQTEEGRASRINTLLECPLCDRLEMPEGMVRKHRSPIFENGSIPKALLSDHATKQGIWARIFVLQGKLSYVVGDPVAKSFMLDTETPGLVVPEVKHYVEPVGDVRFYIELYSRS